MDNTIDNLKRAVLQDVLGETDFPQVNAIAINHLFDKNLHLISGAMCFSSFIDFSFFYVPNPHYSILFGTVFYQ